MSEVEAAAYLSIIRRISEALAAREPGREDREYRCGRGRRTVVAGRMWITEDDLYALMGQLALGIVDWDGSSLARMIADLLSITQP